MKFNLWMKGISDGEYYYFGNALTYGWKQVNGIWYYFDLDTGARVHDDVRTIDGISYQFNTDGTYIKI